MRVQSNLTDVLIKETLYNCYGLLIEAVAFLPIGNDSATFVYQAVAVDGASYFLKVRTLTGFGAPSIVIPRFLSEQRVPHIVTPMMTQNQALWVEMDGFVLTLYPFIDARTATEVGLSDEQWGALGTALRQIHMSRLPTGLQQIVLREPFVPSRRNVLTQLGQVMGQDDLVDPAQIALRAFWQARQDDIQLLIERADTLGAELRQAPLPHVLCHADIHTWNVLLDSKQQMWIVDWDEVIQAPKERDLMFVIGGIASNLVSAHQTTCFLQGYGETDINLRALAYYRYAWAVQEMGAYAEDVFFSPQRSEQTHLDSVNAFIDVFAPGNIAAIACASNNGLHV